MLPPRLRWFAPVCLISYALAVPGAAFAQDQPAPAEPEAAPSEEAPAEPAPAASGEATELSPLQLHQRAQLRKSLEQVEHDRAATSTLLPWLLTGAGALLTVAGMLIGANATWGCGNTCTGASAAPAWMVVAGSTAGVAGLVWLLRTEHDRSEIDTREYRIKTELERMQWNAEPVPHASLAPALKLSASF